MSFPLWTGIGRGTVLTLAFTLSLILAGPVMGQEEDVPAQSDTPVEAVDQVQQETDAARSGSALRVLWQDWSRETFGKASQLRRPIAGSGDDR